MNYIYKKWLNGHSLNVLVCGETGSGKSITGLALLLTLSKLRGIPVNLKKSLYMDLEKFMLGFYTSKRNIYILDEAKIHLSSKKWWSDFNTYFGNILATQRYRENIYIIILPLAKTLAKEHRDMIDVIIEMKGKGWASCYIVMRRWSEIKKFELWRFYVGDLAIKLPEKKYVEEYESIGEQKKEEIYLNMAAEVLGKRRCFCGYPINYLDTECKACGFRWSQKHIYQLIENKLGAMSR